MFKFGKKVNYRPLLISLLIASLVGIPAQDIFKRPLISILVGLGLFSIIFFGYYLPNIPLEFSYWEADEQFIRYVDTSNLRTRILSMFPPFINPLTIIDKTDIKTISVIGNINQDFEAPMAIPYTPALGIGYAAIAMVHNPDYVRVTLKNNQIIDLSIRRDYTYSRNTTLKKLTNFFNSLDNTQIKITLPKVN